MTDILDIQKLKERVTEWITIKNSEGLTQAKMGEIIGTGRAYFNNMKNGTSGIGFAALEHIMKIDPKLSKYWLFFGEGEMYPLDNNIDEQKSSYAIKKKNQESSPLIDELVKQLRLKEDQIKIKDDQIKFLQHIIEDLQKESK